MSWLEGHAMMSGRGLKNAIVVLAGRVDDPPSQTHHGRALCEALRAQPYSGQLHFVDTGTSGRSASRQCRS